MAATVAFLNALSHRRLDTPHPWTLALLEPIGDIPPTQFEELHYENHEAPVMVAGLK